MADLEPKDGINYRNHAVTQAFIGVFMIMMCVIFGDMLIKFYHCGCFAAPVPSIEVKQNSAKSQSQSTTHTEHSNSGSAATGRKSRNTDQIKDFYKITSIICISCFILSVAIDFGDGVYYFASGIDVFHTNEYWLIALTNLFWGISAICLYIFIYGRLYLTFKDTEHALTRTTNIIVIALIIVNSAASVMYVCCYFIRFYHLSLPLFYELLNASNIFILVTDVVINVVILGLFAYKLQQIFVDWGEYDDITHLRGSVAVNRAQIKLAACLTKHAILSTCAMISNVLFYGSVIGGSNVHPIWVLDLYFLGYSNLVKALAGFIVTACIYLNLGLKNRAYNALFGKCHEALQTSFIQMNKKKIKEEVQETKEPSVELNVNDPMDTDTP